MGNILPQPRDTTRTEDSDDEQQTDHRSSVAQGVNRATKRGKRISTLQAIRERSLHGRFDFQHALEDMTTSRPRRAELDKIHLGQVTQILNIKRLLRRGGRISRSAATRLAVRGCIALILLKVFM